jgi:NitT/TauT family transport system substrate-binding protein
MIRARLLAPLGLLALLLSACSGTPAPIRIGVNPWPPCEIWSIAEKEGLLAGVPIQIVRFSTWTDNMAALYKGNVDLTHSSYFNALYFSDKGEAGKLVLVSDTLLGGDGLAVRNTIARGADLKGRKIAVEVNTDEHFLLSKALASYGLAESDVTIVSSTSAEARDLFVSGAVDACFTYEPYLSDAAASGKGRVAWTTKDDPGYMIDVLVARDEVITTRAKALTSVLKGWYAAQRYIATHRSEAYALLAANEQMSGADFGPFYESFTFFTSAENRSLLGSTDFRSRLTEMRDFLVAHKAVGTTPSIDAIFTTAFADGLP